MHNFLFSKSIFDYKGSYILLLHISAAGLLLLCVSSQHLEEQSCSYCQQLQKKLGTFHYNVIFIFT